MPVQHERNAGEPLPAIADQIVSHPLSLKEAA
jgi:hypothetical protein